MFAAAHVYRMLVRSDSGLVQPRAYAMHVGRMECLWQRPRQRRWNFFGAAVLHCRAWEHLKKLHPQFRGETPSRVTSCPGLRVGTWSRERLEPASLMSLEGTLAMQGGLVPCGLLDQ